MHRHFYLLSVPQWKKPSSEQCSIQKKSIGFHRVEKPKVAPMQLLLLPNDILRDILSRLSLREVVRMGMLSREWRRLGICHPDPVFTQDTFGRIVTIHTDEEPATTEFISKVDNLLLPLWATSTTTTTTLDKFVIKFLLGKKHKYNIDRWINFLIASRAKHIALDFDTRETGCEDDMYVFPLCNLSGTNGSCVKYLDLVYVSIKLSPSFYGIMNLKTLALNRVSINPSDLQCLLLSCSFLESLRIEWCSWSNLCIRQEQCRLQYLCVRHCELEMLELHAPNLTKFEFDEDLKQIILSDCLKLSDATFVSYMRTQEFYDYDFDDLTFTFIEFATALPHVDKLFLLLNFDQVLRFSETQNSFLNLRHLNMNLEIGFDVYDDSWVTGFVNLLESAPLLEELELHLGRRRLCHPAMRMATAAQGPLHHHLKSVHMSGFCDVLGLAELALYILLNATVLKQMVVDPMAYGNTLHTDDIYSFSKTGSIEGDLSNVDQNMMFAEKNLGKEEFLHIVTIL